MLMNDLFRHINNPWTQILFSHLPLSRLWIRICRNSISNSTQIQCQRISNYTRPSTCWFRQLAPWAVSWFIASSKETSWKSLLLTLIQVCKVFLSFSVFPSTVSFVHRSDRKPHYFRHYVISVFSYPVNVGVASTTSASILLSACLPSLMMMVVVR